MIADHQPPPAIVQHEWLNRTEAAALCRMHPVTWDGFRRKSLAPAPTYLGATPLWNRQELLDWLKAGAPDRDTWEQLKAERQSARA